MLYLWKFSVPIKKKLQILINFAKFIDSAKFFSSSLSNLVDNLTERIHKITVRIVIVNLNMKRLRIIS